MAATRQIWFIIYPLLFFLSTLILLWWILTVVVVKLTLGWGFSGAEGFNRGLEAATDIKFPLQLVLEVKVWKDKEKIAFWSLALISYSLSICKTIFFLHFLLHSKAKWHFVTCISLCYLRTFQGFFNQSPTLFGLSLRAKKPKGFFHNRNYWHLQTRLKLSVKFLPKSTGA